MQKMIVFMFIKHVHSVAFTPVDFFLVKRETKRH